MALNIANLSSSEERAQFRQIAGTTRRLFWLFGAAGFAFSGNSCGHHRRRCVARMVAPNVISTTPLDSKVKSAIFVLFDKARKPLAF